MVTKLVFFIIHEPSGMPGCQNGYALTHNPGSIPFFLCHFYHTPGHYTVGYQATVRNLYDAAGMMGTVLTVSNHNNGHALSVKPAQQCHYLLGVFFVQVAGGLIGQQHGWFIDNCPGNGNPL